MTAETNGPGNAMTDQLTDERRKVALDEFTEYFAKNYPGPNTIISNPRWHAPKIFRAAEYAITTALAARQPTASAAQAVAWQVGAPNKPWSNEWFIAQTKCGDRVVLRALPDDWTYDFTTADETYIMRDRIVRWMQFPDSKYAAPPPAETPAPAPDAKPPLFVSFNRGGSVRCALLDEDEARHIAASDPMYRYEAMTAPAPADALVEALERSIVALDDWLNTYAPELCDDDRVRVARERIAEHGTLGYIADVQAGNNAALAAHRKGKS